MRVRWAEVAQLQLPEIGEYIARDNESAAETMIMRIRDAVGHLGAYPAIGRVGRVSDTRELVVSGTPYIVVYTVYAGSVQVAAIWHAKRAWPNQI
jgi:toxin ParE1/3/4